MGTTRIKVIDLSSEQQEIKTSRKHARLAPLAERAGKLASPAKKEPKVKDLANSKLPVSLGADTGPEEAQQEAASNVTVQDEPETQTAEKKSQEKTGKTKSSQKKSVHHEGANYIKARKLVEDKLYKIQEAFDLLPKTSFTKFDPAVEVHFGVSEKNIRGTVNFPHAKESKKKEKRYLVFADKKIQTENKNVIWANEKTIEEIENGKLRAAKDFDMVVANPHFMPILAKVAKILGPRGMMPNPKNGTVTENIQKFLEDSAASTSYEFKADPSAPVMHVKIGKLSQKPEELAENLKALTLSIGSSKIKKATLTTTMGPAIRIDTATL